MKSAWLNGCGFGSRLTTRRKRWLGTYVAGACSEVLAPELLAASLAPVSASTMISGGRRSLSKDSRTHARSRGGR